QKDAQLKAQQQKDAQLKAQQQKEAQQRKAAEEKAARERAAANRNRLNNELDNELADTKKASAQEKTAQAKQTASNATRDFRNKVDRTWQPPVGKTGEKATVSVTLTATGQVASVFVSASDPAVKASAEKAVRAAAPYPMPSDPEARRLAQSFKSTLTVK
ncbi:cell envelope integrity protein TolA, partial [Acinetobacter rudis]